MTEGEFSKRLARASLKCNFEKPGIGPMALRNTYIYKLFLKDPKEALYASSERSMPALCKKLGFNTIKVNKKAKVAPEFFSEESIIKSLYDTPLTIDKIRIEYENNTSKTPQNTLAIVELVKALNKAIADYNKNKKE